MKSFPYSLFFGVVVATIEHAALQELYHSDPIYSEMLNSLLIEEEPKQHYFEIRERVPIHTDLVTTGSILPAIEGAELILQLARLDLGPEEILHALTERGISQASPGIVRGVSMLAAMREIDADFFDAVLHSVPLVTLTSAAELAAVLKTIEWIPKELVNHLVFIFAGCMRVADMVNFCATESHWINTTGGFPLRVYRISQPQWLHILNRMPKELLLRRMTTTPRIHL